MKILHLETGRFFYGGPQQVIYLCNALKDFNVDNILVCPPDSEIDEIARKIGIRVINLRCGGDFDIFFGYSLCNSIIMLLGWPSIISNALS